MKCPCKGCPDRHEACHDRCERYKGWKAAHDAQRIAIREEKDLDATLNAGTFARRDEWFKSQRKRGRSGTRGLTK